METGRDELRAALSEWAAATKDREDAQAAVFQANVRLADLNGRLEAICEAAGVGEGELLSCPEMGIAVGYDYSSEVIKVMVVRLVRPEGGPSC